MKKINWGIVGLGNIANTFANAFNSVTNSKLLAVSSKNLNNIKTFKERFQIPNKYCFQNYEELISCEDIDIIYIALPHNLHFKWIIKCIEHNKNILVEKPATVDLNEMKIVNEKLKNSNLFFAEAFMYLYHPQSLSIVDIIKKNKIGELQSMESNFGFNAIEKKFLGFKWYKINKKKRLFNKKLGGGSILDIGCYPCSLSVIIAKLKSRTDINKLEIKNIKKDFGSIDVDLEAHAELHFDNNFISKIKSSFKKNLGQSTKIIGTMGEIFIENSWSCNPSKIIINGNNYDNFNNSSKNVYSFQIQKISECLLKKENKPIYPAMNRHDSEENMQILNKWIKN